jgi:hypothetical protein
MNADTARLRILGRTTAVVAVLALINGVRLAAGTTTIGPTTVAAHFESDARVLIALAAFGVAAASQVGTRTRSRRMARVAAVRQRTLPDDPLARLVGTDARRDPKDLPLRGGPLAPRPRR